MYLMYYTQEDGTRAYTLKVTGRTQEWVCLASPLQHRTRYIMPHYLSRAEN